jgi:transposase
MLKTRPPCPPEFRREAVQLVFAGRSVKDVAESLGCSEQSLHNGSSSTSSIVENAMTG